MWREVLPDRQLHMRFCTWKTYQNFLSYGGERTQNSKHREEATMLKELAIQEFEQVIGGSAMLTKLEGTMTTIYRDENGVIKCGTWPWPRPKPWPIITRPRPKPLTKV
jgi:hypothetical protein